MALPPSSGGMVGGGHGGFPPYLRFQFNSPEGGLYADRFWPGDVIDVSGFVTNTAWNTQHTVREVISNVVVATETETAVASEFLPTTWTLVSTVDRGGAAGQAATAGSFHDRQRRLNRRKGRR